LIPPSPDPADIGNRDVPPLPRDDGLPTFAEPWQAQAFALAVRLSAEGHFSWPEWVSVFSEELAGSKARGDPDDNASYYLCWLAALERMVVSKGLSDLTEMAMRKEAWADAYRHTPHGQPVELRDGSNA